MLGNRAAAVLCSTGLAILFAVAVVRPAQAEDASRWTFRFRGLGSNYDHQFTSAYFTTTRLDVDQGQGFELAAELRQNRFLGWELAVGQLSMDARLNTTQLRPVSFDPLVLREETIFSSTGDFRLTPISLSLVFHPLQQRRWDVYIAPQVAWVRFDPRIEGAQAHEAEAAYGGKIGAELPFGSSWSLGLELRHLEIPHESVDRDLYGDIGLDVGSLVFAYRFGSRVN